MLELPDVMLCAISSIAIEQTVAALNRSVRGIEFGDVVLFTDVDPHLVSGSEIRWEKISPIRSKESYSHFIIKDLAKYVTHPFVLIVQWDGYVANPKKWNPAFLDYDYIGAPWPQFEDTLTVGNGGFSLRSKRLLQVLADDDFLPLHPEDTAICRLWRKRLEREFGIKFPDATLASTFSCERSGNMDLAFGFHGMFNMLNILSSEEIDRMSAALPMDMLMSRDYADLIAKSSEYGMRRLAWTLLFRRLCAKPADTRQLKLLLTVLRCRR